MRAPAVAASPSPVPAATPPAAPTAPTPAPSAGAEPSASPAPDQPAPDAAIDQPAADSTETIEAPLDWRAFVPTDTADHLATMDRAARESGCGVPWHLLAAIARVESDFGRNMATSSAGAMGYGQFLPSSWQSFGNDGNVYDYRDALPAIATYLCQSGLERDPRTALFAYNHADWYVDLVLNLAVRYDRMTPGAPTPAVLDVGPATDSVMQLHYAAGRDVRHDTRRHAVEGQADWLGIPWQGRAPGAPISLSSLQGTTLAMVRTAFGVTTRLPQTSEPAVGGLTAYADRAWEAGLLAAPIEPPLLLPVPDERRPLQTAQWSIAEIRRTLQRGQPLVAVVASRLLPGHPPTESFGDQPLVLIGQTPTGLVYSDPSFSSSLGYGLELAEGEFLTAWQAAATPFQAVALSVRPGPLARAAHVREAEPPPVYARALPTPAPAFPAPQPTLSAAPVIAAEPPPAQVDAAAEFPVSEASATESASDMGWTPLLLGAGAALLVAGVLGVVGLRLRPRRSPGP